MNYNYQPVSVVILAHNEVEIIEQVINDFQRKIIKKIPFSEIIIAEDGSTDGTKDILKKLTSKYNSLKWIEGKEKLGYVQAYKNSLKKPRNELILFCDCSGKHDPDDFWSLYELISKNDMVIGFKKVRNDPVYRVILGKIFNFFVRKYFKVNFKDIDCPLRLIKKTPLNKILKQNFYETNLINFELTLRFHFSGYKVAETPVKHFQRLNGSSRGLPLKKIPLVILEVLKNFPRIKKDFEIRREIK